MSRTVGGGWEATNSSTIDGSIRQQEVRHFSCTSINSDPPGSKVLGTMHGWSAFWVVDQPFNSLKEETVGAIFRNPNVRTAYCEI